MEKIKSKKNIEIKVQFEFMNEYDILSLSKEFKIKISLDENTDFEVNKNKIISGSIFKTIKERKNYHMFNKSKKKFFTQNSDFIPYINTKSNIILINYRDYCTKVIENFNKYTSIFNKKDEKEKISELKSKEIINELICLENNLKVDLFADEFIYKKGIQYLMNLIGGNYEEIRYYSLICINMLLSWENAFDFFDKNEDYLNILYKAFIGNNNREHAFIFYDIIIKLIGRNQKHLISCVNMCNNTFFKKSIQFLVGENKENFKTYILFLLNTKLNYDTPHNQYELISELFKSGFLDILGQNLDDISSEQIDMLESTVENILKNSQKKSDYEEVQKIFNDFCDNKKYCKIQNLVLNAENENDKIKNESINNLKNIITENDNNIYLIYESFLHFNELEKVNSFYNYFLYLFVSDQNQINNFIETSKKISEKTKTKPLYINYLFRKSSKKDDLLNIQTFSFINKILSLCLSFSKKDEFFDFLHLLIINCEVLQNFDEIDLNNKNENFIKEYNKFIEILDKNISKEDTKDKNILSIKEKYNKRKEQKMTKEINDLLLKMHNLQGTNHDKAANNLINMIKEKENFEFFFKMFLFNDIKNLSFSYFEVFTILCGGKDEQIYRFIQTADKFESKFKINAYEIIIKYLEPFQNELVQINALKLINCLLSSKDRQQMFKLLHKLYKLYLFDYLCDLIKKEEKSTDIFNYIDVLLYLIDSILKENKKANEFEQINEMFKQLKEKKEFFDSTMDGFVILDDF